MFYYKTNNSYYLYMCRYSTVMSFLSVYHPALPAVSYFLQCLALRVSANSQERYGSMGLGQLKFTLCYGSVGLGQLEFTLCYGSLGLGQLEFTLCYGSLGLGQLEFTLCYGSVGLT